MVRSELSQLVSRYAAAVDQTKFGVAAALFTADAELVLPEPPRAYGPIRSIVGRPAISEGLSQVRHFDVTFHAIVGEVFTPSGDVAAIGRVSCVAHHVRDGRDWVWHLHYDDRYRCVGHEWKIEYRALTVDFIDERTVMTAGRPPER